MTGLESLKYAEFLTVKNRVVSRPPFILICKNTQFDTVQEALDAGVTLDNFNQYLGAPHPSELMTIYEQYCTLKFPLEPIKALSNKCK